MEIHEDLPGRKGTFNEAKRDLGIPKTQHPDGIKIVPMREAEYEGGHVIKNEQGSVMYTREYYYTTDRGTFIIQDHSSGHTKGDEGSHFNVRPIAKPRTGTVDGTKYHYPFSK
jgi:toxin YxiD